MFDWNALALWLRVVDQALQLGDGSRQAGAGVRGFGKNPWAWFVRRGGSDINV